MAGGGAGPVIDGLTVVKEEGMCEGGKEAPGKENWLGMVGPEGGGCGINVEKGIGCAGGGGDMIKNGAGEGNEAAEG